MKLPILPLFLCWNLASAATQAAVEGQVYIYNPNSPRQLPTFKSDTAPLSPTAARVVLAQRIGVEEHHSSHLYDPEVIGAVNEFGVRIPLFSQQQEEKQEGVKRALFFLQTRPENLKKHISSNVIFTSHFDISPLPSLATAQALYTDLQLQKYASTPTRRADFFAYENLNEVMPHLQQLVELGDISITVFAITSETVEEETAVAWATYEGLPGLKSQREKRQEPTRQQEKPLEQAPGLDQDFSPISSSPQPLKTLQSQSSQSPLPGILPSCYPSLSSCSQSTRNCTGHGSCQLAYSDKSQQPARDCYSCQCSATTHKSSTGGTITTNWGGPACQKKDVSVQFWLIALFSVALVGVVSGAVGMVWGMGEEGLPSVIGAGVSGPTARR